MLRSRQFVLQATVLILYIIVSLMKVNAEGLRSSDLLSLRSVTDVQFSPDGSRLAYTVENNDGPGRPYSQIWIVGLGDGKALRIGGEKEVSSRPVWSPDGRWIAFQGHDGDKSGLMITQPDGSERKFLSAIQGTNNPFPSTGNTIAWSPDGKRIAFINVGAWTRN